MKPKIKISASFICTDLFSVKNDLEILYEEGINYIHYDIMDGHFVPRIGLGTFFLKQLVKNQPIPLDVHLMVDDPEKYIDEIAGIGASIITTHYESGKDIYSIINKIDSHKNTENKVKKGIALSPDTSLNLILPFLKSLDLVLLMAYSPGTYSQKPVKYLNNRIKELRELIDEKSKRDIDIAIDGGLGIENIKNFKENGANFFIFGTSGLFIQGKKLRNQIRLIKDILEV